MIEQPNLLHQLPAIILAGVCTYVWLVACDRRKALDRYISKCTCDIYLARNLDLPKRDAIDCVIARSVKRVTK